MIVLDTNVVSELFRHAPETRVVAWLTALDDEVAITSMTLAELLAGVGLLPDGRRRDALRTAIDGVVAQYRGRGAILPFDDAAAAEYAQVLAQRRAAGLPVSTVDAQIAAVCRARGAVCATRNTRDFVRTGVDLVDPWAAT